jgi:hypothetical protein
VTQPEPRPSSVRTVQVKSRSVNSWKPNTPFELAIVSKRLPSLKKPAVTSPAFFAAKML